MHELLLMKNRYFVLLAAPHAKPLSAIFSEYNRPYRKSQAQDAINTAI